MYYLSKVVTVSKILILTFSWFASKTVEILRILFDMLKAAYHTLHNKKYN